MVKLIFKAYKNIEIFFHILHIKMVTGYYKKDKEKLSRKAREKYQNLYRNSSEEEEKRKVS